VYKIGLFLGTNPSSGGAFQYCQAMVEAFVSLPKSEYAKVIVFSSDYWESKLIDYEIYNRKIKNGVWGKALGKVLQAIDLPTVWIRKIYSLFHPIGINLTRYKCDLWIFPAAEAWAYQIPVPALVTIYDLMHRYERRYPEISAKGLYEWREKHYSQICKLAKGILVDSNLSKIQTIESYFTDPNKIHVLPYVPAKYIYNKETPTGFERRYQHLGKFIFYPAQFWEHKNHKGLVLAVNILRDKYPDLKLIFVGSKKNGYHSTCDMVKRLNLIKNIRFFGYVPDEDIPQFYRRARGMIMPTFLGPTNIPPLEANALGSPVAVSNIYAMPEQLGDAAIYFDPSSVEEIAHAIEEIWTNDKLCRKLKERGLKRNTHYAQFHFNKEFQKIVETVFDQV